MTRRIFGCSRSGALRLGRPLHDVTGRLFDRAALSPRSRARHHQNTCAGNSQKLGMHTNLRRLTKRSPTKRGRCRLCSVPAGHGGQAWHVRFACGERQCAALLECGAALAAGKRVFVVSPYEWTFANHERCRSLPARETVELGKQHAGGTFPYWFPLCVCH
jgi:hypothetical protein